ncbi:MAG TPA: hypothetical protein VFF30_18555 [Nitrososphaerales archaeon]|nr:hypothetical protein [Nitrososphaerales archaeon]
MSTSPSSTSSTNTTTGRLEFEEYIVKRDGSGIWRRCPYCGEKVLDGLAVLRPPGSTFI